MSTETQHGTLDSIKAGPCSVYYKGAFLGFTQDGAEVEIEEAWEDVVVDEHGESPVDALLTSENLTVTVTLSEFTMSNLRKVIPGATQVIDGGKEAVTFGRTTGFRARSYAGELTLHPIANATADVSEDLTVWLAYVSEPVTFSYTYNDVRSYEVTFRALVDVGQDDGRRIAIIGDKTVSADVTAPAVDSIVPTDEQSGVSVTANVVITMDDNDLDSASMTASTVMLIKDADGVQVAAALSWDVALSTITLNPNASLSGSSDYRVVVNGLKDVSGNQMTQAFTSIFTTT